MLAKKFVAIPDCFSNIDQNNAILNEAIWRVTWAFTCTLSDFNVKAGVLWALSNLWKISTERYYKFCLTKRKNCGKEKY